MSFHLRTSSFVSLERLDARPETSPHGCGVTPNRGATTVPAISPRPPRPNGVHPTPSSAVLAQQPAPGTPWRRRWYKRRHAGAGRLGRRQQHGAGPAAQPDRRGHRAQLRALARRAAPAPRRDRRRAGGGSLRGPRRRRSRGPQPRAVPDDRDRPADVRGDRRPAARARDPRRAHSRCGAAPAARHRRRPSFGRVSTKPPAHADVPRRPDRPARRRLRQPLPHREGRRAGLHRRGRGAHPPPRRAGGRRDRERAPLRVLDPLAPPARGPQRDRGGPRVRGRARAAPRPRRPADAGAGRRANRADRFAGRAWVALGQRGGGSRRPRRHRHRPAHEQGRTRARAGANRTRQRHRRRPRGRPTGRARARRHVGDVPAAHRAGHADRSGRRARQARRRRAFRRGRRPSRRVPRGARGDRGRPLASA